MGTHLDKQKAHDFKREAAEARQAEHNKLTIAERIQKLDNKLGQDIGAKKERLKLSKLLDAKQDNK